MLIVNRPAAQREECPYTNSYVAGEGACGHDFLVGSTPRAVHTNLRDLAQARVALHAENWYVLKSRGADPSARARAGLQPLDSDAALGLRMARRWGKGIYSSFLNCCVELLPQGKTRALMQTFLCRTHGTHFQ